MDRNENGYPGGTVGGVTDGGMNGCGCGCGNGNGNGNGNGSVGGVADDNNHSCGGDGTCLDTMPLAYVYAPNQKFRMLYSAADALRHGTLFEELYKPMEVYGRE